VINLTFNPFVHHFFAGASPTLTINIWELDITRIQLFLAGHQSGVASSVIGTQFA
jgi:hypothetical protein